MPNIKNAEKEIIKRLYNQLMDSQKKRIYPLFDPDAHTREEYLAEKSKEKFEMKERSLFWKWMDRIFN